jgi:hypothetical protein
MQVPREKKVTIKNIAFCTAWEALTLPLDKTCTTT